MKEKTFMELIAPTFDSDGVQVSSAIGSDGKEYPDPCPMAPPVDFPKQPDVYEMIRRVVRNEQLMKAADLAGFDTFEEAEDFTVDEDDEELVTEYEKVFEPPAVAAAGANGGDSQPTAAPPVEVSKPVVSSSLGIEGSKGSDSSGSKTESP